MELDFRTVVILNRLCVVGNRPWRPLRCRAYDVSFRALHTTCVATVPRSSQKVRNEEKKLTRPVDVELDFRLELDFRPVAILNRVCVGGAAPAPGPGGDAF